MGNHLPARKSHRTPVGPVSGDKTLAEMINETSAMIGQLSTLNSRVVEIILEALEKIDPSEITIRDFRDLGYILAVGNDKRQGLMEQKAGFEGAPGAMQTRILERLDTLADARQELARREQQLDERERQTVDITGGEDADQDAGSREEPQGDAAVPAQAQADGARQPVPPQRRARPPHVPHSNVRPRGPRI